MIDWGPFRRVAEAARERNGAPFGTSVWDPPWKFNDNGSRLAPDQKGKLQRGKGYKVLPTADICNIPLADYMAENSHLYLWVPDVLVFSHALPVLNAWGYEHKLFIKWIKCQVFERGREPAKDSIIEMFFKEVSRFFDIPTRFILGGLQIGGGHYWRRASEVCIFATRGRAPVPPANRLPDTIFSPRTKAANGEKHSAKPRELLEKIERASPGPYLEGFARTAHPGWTSFGDQLKEAA